MVNVRRMKTIETILSKIIKVTINENDSTLQVQRETTVSFLSTVVLKHLTFSWLVLRSLISVESILRPKSRTKHVYASKIIFCGWKIKFLVFKWSVLVHVSDDKRKSKDIDIPLTVFPLSTNKRIHSTPIVAKNPRQRLFDCNF